jgi:hypothetical protein
MLQVESTSVGAGGEHKAMIGSMIRRRILVAAAAATALATLALLAPDQEIRLRVVTEQSQMAPSPPSAGAAKLR